MISIFHNYGTKLNSDQQYLAGTMYRSYVLSLSLALTSGTGSICMMTEKVKHCVQWYYTFYKSEKWVK